MLLPTALAAETPSKSARLGSHDAYAGVDLAGALVGAFCVVAVIEIVSPGNKSSSHALGKFTEKGADRLDAGVHLLIVDLFPPGTFDPGGLHSAIWQNSSEENLQFNPEKPLTLASHVGGEMLEATSSRPQLGRH
jgi:hypothetical protein